MTTRAKVGMLAAGVLGVLAWPVTSQTVTHIVTKLVVTSTADDSAQFKGPLVYRTSGINGAEGINAYFANVNYPTTFRHKIASSISDNTALSWLTFSLTTGSASFIDVLTLRATGRVGIGTTAPDEVLEVVKDGTPADGAFGFKILSAASDTTLVMGASAASDYSYIQSALSKGSWSNRPLYLMPMGGSVGVGGTTTPTYTLEVLGALGLRNAAASAGSVHFYEDSDNGTNTAQLIGPASTADVVITLPAASGTLPLQEGVIAFMHSVEPVTTTKSPGAAETNEVYTNEGDADGATITLPTAAAGLTYTIYVQVAQTLTVTAGSGDTIRIAANVTAAAGSITSATVGSSVTLVAINATEWVARSAVGSWAF